MDSTIMYINQRNAHGTRRERTNKVYISAEA